MKQKYQCGCERWDYKKLNHKIAWTLCGQHDQELMPIMESGKVQDVV